MKQITLLYHDVIDGCEVSGFSDPAAQRYKLTRSEFVKHLDAVAAAMDRPPVTVDGLFDAPTTPPPVTLGFDDGGVSSLSTIAAELGRRGWPAHFFIATDFIGSHGFLSAQQIRELRQMGHVIGSHSCSHPNPMAACSWESLIDEWSRSVATLSDILQEAITVASIPGGAYSRKVARAAAAAGVTRLFTSEPTRRTWTVGGCVCFGRFSIEREDAPSKAAAIVAQEPVMLAKEFAVWNVKQAIKRVAGPLFYRVDRWRNS